jgi:hypothetical protein
MTENELRTQELIRHEQRIDQNIERHQALNLDEKKRGIAVANQNSVVARIVNIVYFLFGALELLLAVRLILYLIGANLDNSFASFITDLSAPFVALFASLLKNPTLGTTGVFEVTTLIAMLVYTIVVWLMSRLIWLTLSRSR